MRNVSWPFGEAMRGAQHELIASANGHDTFLIDYDLIDELVRRFLSESARPAR